MIVYIFFLLICRGDFPFGWRYGDYAFFSSLVIDTKATNLLVHGLNETVCTWKHAKIGRAHV